MKENNCPEISVTELQSWQQQQRPFVLVDVREPFEYEICNLGGKLIPLKELSQRSDELPRDQTIVVHCKSGGRSRQAVEFLQQAGFKNVLNLKGGIMAWAEEIDLSLPKYW